MAEKFAWTSEYETGIDEIDRQHRDLFKKFDNFSIAIYNGEGKNQLKELMAFIDSYINNHFKEEEELLSLNNYPDIYKHLEYHKKFTSIFGIFKKEFEKRGGDTYMALQLEKEIRGWWKNHILTVDKLYVPYITIKTKKNALPDDME